MYKVYGITYYNQAYKNNVKGIQNITMSVYKFIRWQRDTVILQQSDFETAFALRQYFKKNCGGTPLIEKTLSYYVLLCEGDKARIKTVCIMMMIICGCVLSWMWDKAATYRRASRQRVKLLSVLAQNIVDVPKRRYIVEHLGHRTTSKINSKSGGERRTHNRLHHTSLYTGIFSTVPYDKESVKLW